MTILRQSMMTSTAGRAVVTALAISGLALTSACSIDQVLGKKDIPSTMVDPNDAKTSGGAYDNYMSALITFRDAVGRGDASYVNVTGLLTDENHSTEDPNGGNISGANVDSRIIPEDRSGAVGYNFYGAYGTLQLTRGQANQAQQLLNDYFTGSAKNSLMAHMLATKGYAELLLAEAFCSGVPLSTLDYNGDYTLKPGSRTDDVLNHAIAQFDSAIALAGDSARVLNLARVGKGRALLQQGKFAEAAQAVETVPVSFTYDLQFSRLAKACGLLDCAHPTTHLIGQASDNEGENGLPYVSSGDPRLPTFISAWGIAYMNVPDVHSIRLASGVEAQLIRVEAELKAADPNWLVRLNKLRTSCTDGGTCASPAPAGDGGVANLAPLADPGADSTRVDLLFRERAYWTYFTGHRQGDLRRLVRWYRRSQFKVYPTGVYGANARYGSDITFPIPQDEKRLNPNFHGCYDRQA